MSTSLPSIERLVEDCQAICPGEYAATPVAAALAILTHAPRSPENLKVVADLLREEVAEHMPLVGRVEPRLAMVLWAVTESLQPSWEFENGEWHHYPPREVPLPSVRATLQQEARLEGGAR